MYFNTTLPKDRELLRSIITNTVDEGADNYETEEEQRLYKHEKKSKQKKPKANPDIQKKNGAPSESCPSDFTLHEHIKSSNTPIRKSHEKEKRY